jgi:integrase
MARLGNRLAAAFVAKVTTPGWYPDGHGLYLLVGKTGGKSWVYRYKRPGQRLNTDMGLGPLHTVSLADARRKALACRQQRLDGIDPLAERSRRRQAQQGPESVTFEWCARQYILAHSAGWKDGGKSAAQWGSSLATYVVPVFGRRPVQEIDTGLVMQVLEPIWREKTETASRVRRRIESILDWATTRGHRQGENPARWRGHIENLLPRPSKVRSTQHHAALPSDELPAFLDALKCRQGVSPRAVEFVTLTCARTAEAINATWAEVDFAERVWTIPASRMKGGAEHRVPLSPQAIAVLERMAEIRQSDFVFSGQAAGGPLRQSAMRMLLKQMGCNNTTIHGIRSSFSTWAHERTSFAPEIIEASLAHKVGNAVERAYRRGDFFNKRRRLMEAWGEFVTKPATNAEVIKLRAV